MANSEAQGEAHGNFLLRDRKKAERTKKIIVMDLGLGLTVSYYNLHVSLAKQFL